MEQRAPFPTPWQARALLALSVALAVYGCALTRAPSAPLAVSAKRHGDIDMYRAVAERVHAGEPYYATVFQELGSRGYATSPFWNFRLPTLAYLAKWLPDPTQLLWLLRAIGVAATASWVLAIRRASGERASLAAFVLLLPTLAITMTPGGFWLHEAWAGLLLSLSLALDALHRSRSSLLAWLAAACVRELSVLHAGVRLVVAARERRPAVVVQWLLALAVFAAIVLVHARSASDFIAADTLHSPSWLALGGYRFLLNLAERSALLVSAPDWVTALVLPTCVYGFAAGSAGATRNVGPVVLAYLAAWLFIGRPDNDYWGFVIAPLLPLGLLQLPKALRRARAAPNGSSAISPPLSR
jgi:hypothetical protein